jgi:hypothetical protein
MKTFRDFSGIYGILWRWIIESRYLVRPHDTPLKGCSTRAYGSQVGPLRSIFTPKILKYFEIILQKSPSDSEHFYFCTKITPILFCWKQHQSRLVSFKSCKLEARTIAKVFGKVGTLETYHSPKLNLLLVLKQFSWQTESDKEKFYKLIFFCRST